MIHRDIKHQILHDFNKNKIIVVLGPRQVGKTTLLNDLVASDRKILFLNCDDYDDAAQLENKTSTQLRQLLKGYDLAFIDEAQRVADIGLTLKKIGDMKLPTKVVVTGSASLDIASKVNEPATGRLIEYNLFPFSLGELAADTSEKEQTRLLSERMIYGFYPEIVTDPAYAKRTLVNLANNYLYKDIFTYQGIKKPEVLQKLVRALALQVGSEVSYDELAQLISIDRATVEKYIGLLEKCFIVFRLNSYSTNQRNEIKKGKKVYFYDNGIRNAIISNFAPLELRNDTGALWENLIVSERIKRNAYTGSYAQLFFWRNTNQQEIDLIEDCDGQLHAFEFKFNPKKAKAHAPKAFAELYPEHTFKCITPTNFWPFVALH